LRARSLVGAALGILVGEHLVEMRYRPGALVFGIALSALAAAMALAVAALIAWGRLGRR
jgi:hypothetical protein